MNKLFLLVPALCGMLTACHQNSSMGTQSNGMMMDQPVSAEDMKITKKINNWLMSNNSLSSDAKNIQVMTSNGVVTLSGSVVSYQEKNMIINKVMNMDGVDSVNDQLKIDR